MKPRGFRGEAPIVQVLRDPNMIGFRSHPCQQHVDAVWDRHRLVRTRPLHKPQLVRQLLPRYDSNLLSCMLVSPHPVCCFPTP
jgi:hypothetical protein